MEVNYLEPELCTFQPYVFAEIIADTGDTTCLLHQQPEARSGHRTVCDEANLYSFGGYQKSGSLIETHHKLFEELWCFNLAESRWKYLPTSGDAPKELASHCAILYGNFLHVFGGTGVSFGESTSNKLHICDLRSLKWEEANTTGDPPTPQYGQAVVFDEARKYMYVIGGTTGFEFSMDIHRISLATKAWELIYACKGDQSEPLPRYRHEVAFDGKNIYVFGGGTSMSAYALKIVPTFNLESRKWSMLKTKRNLCPSISDTNQEIPAFPGRRKCHASVQMGNDVYICGGCNGTKVLNDIWKFNISTRRWHLLPVHLPVPLSFHTANLTPDGCMYTFGGVTDIVKGIRTNQVFKIWLKIPKLKEICWEALLRSNQEIRRSGHEALLQMGIPMDFVKRVHPSPPGRTPEPAVESIWKSDLLDDIKNRYDAPTAQSCLSSFV